MKALLFEQYGAPDVLRVASVDEPHAGPGQIRIAVRTAGVSPGDDTIRSGAWRDRVPLSLPYVVGLDAAGTVDEIGDGVTGVREGDEVFGLRARGGTTAEHALLDAWTAKPPTMTWAQAGGAAASIETSVRALDALGVGPGTTVLIDGAAGGVGAIAVQIALARGADVIGTASPANHAFLASLGAHPLPYGPGLPARVAALAASSDPPVAAGPRPPAGIGSPADVGSHPPVRIGSPVDVALDVAGHGGLAELIALTGDPSAVVTLVDPRAAAAGVRLVRFDPAGDHRAALTYGAGLVAAGRLTVHVAATFPMSAGAAAHARVAAGHARGKVVIEEAE